MKSVISLFALLAMLLSSSLIAQEAEELASDPTTELGSALPVPEKSFEEMVSEAPTDGNPEDLLAQLGVTTPEAHANGCMASPLLVLPRSQVITRGFDGVLTHIGYYATGYLVTALDGPRYGCQVGMLYDGRVISVNCDFIMIHGPRGMVQRHCYPGYFITTGFNQAITYY